MAKKKKPTIDVEKFMNEGVLVEKEKKTKTHTENVEEVTMKEQEGIVLDKISEAETKENSENSIDKSENQTNEMESNDVNLKEGKKESLSDDSLVKEKDGTIDNEGNNVLPKEYVETNQEENKSQSTSKNYAWTWMGWNLDF